MIRVGVVGFGTIGSRVAGAVRAQGDIDLVGVVKRTPDYRAAIAISSRGLRFYALDEKWARAWEERGLPLHGTLEDLLRSVDIIIDATPGGEGAKLKPIYETADVPAVFQGGEDPEVAEASFVAQVNYEAARGKRYVRVVSCNTTGLSRLLWVFKREFGIEKAIVTIVRRSADPKEVKRGPIDAIVPDPVSIPSHHARDVLTVIPDLNIVTSAVKVPTTHGHVHSLALKLSQKASREEVLSVLSQERRIVLVSGRGDGFRSTADLLEVGRELGRPRADIYENIVWSESVRVDGEWVFLLQAIHQEAIVVPENIDAVRSMLTDIEAERSMSLTDSSLGIVRGRLYRLP
ncbi:MAG TPA: type II glyceraldehyde-3-phosphate dehydrogenase [Candidatus Korarchaeota archaeon]|nr:type II glyceraldehyde-3-phosphate dehydrogenase [Candidatus Korarchaeota archaeon]